MFPLRIRTLPPADMDSKKLAYLCRDLADNRKAENIVVLDVRELSSVTDYFVIASGSSEPHLRAIADEISDRLREDEGEVPRARDGTVQAGWVVLDFFDVIVHVMRTDVRSRYDLESLWGDAPRVKPKTKGKANQAGAGREEPAPQPRPKPGARAWGTTRGATGGATGGAIKAVRGVKAVKKVAARRTKPRP